MNGHLDHVAIARAAAWCRRADDDVVREVADYLGDLLAERIKAEPDHDARDRHVCAAAELFFGDVPSKSRRADLLATELSRYRGGADWRDRDRFATANPYEAAARRHWLWLILRAVDYPPSARRLRAIIE